MVGLFFLEDLIARYQKSAILSWQCGSHGTRVHVMRLGQPGGSASRNAAELPLPTAKHLELSQTASITFHPQQPTTTIPQHSILTRRDY
jgi:hypothetical protein